MYVYNVAYPYQCPYIYDFFVCFLLYAKVKWTTLQSIQRVLSQEILTTQHTEVILSCCSGCFLFHEGSFKAEGNCTFMKTTNIQTKVDVCINM